MTEDLAIPSFGLTSARPNTVRERVGGVPGLRRTPKSRILGLVRRPSGECRFHDLAGEETAVCCNSRFRT